MNQSFQRLRILFIHLAGLLFIYTVLRFIFFLTYHRHLQDMSTADQAMLFIYGLRYDISAITLLNSLFIILSLLPLNIVKKPFFQRTLLILFVATNSIAIAASVADIGYFNYSNRRMTGAVIHFLARPEDSWSLLPTFLKNYWYLFLLFCLALYNVVIFYKKAAAKDTTRLLSARDYLSATAILLMISGFWVIGIRGGLQKQPLRMVMAGSYCRSAAIPFVLNTPYTILQTITKPQLGEANYMAASEAARHYDCEKRSGITTTTSNAVKKNVVIIILESFSKELTSLGSGRSCTPFLDSLMTHSLVMTNAYANGKQSVEGIPAVLASMPSWFAKDYITSSYGTNRVNSLGSILKQSGYSCSFYHGGKNGTMNFNDFIRLSDAGSYYGKNEYPDEGDFDGNWGIWDEPYLQYISRQMGKMQQPFFTSVFTLSSHNPFAIPEKYKGVFNDYGSPFHNSVRYTDHALKLFFDSVKTLPCYKNTLFVFTADHTGTPGSDFSERSVGNYQIPIVFYDPDNSLQRKDSSLFQQIDIMPTVLDLLHINTPYYSFGSRLSDTSNHKFVLYNIENSYQFICADTLIQFDGTNVTGVYNLRNDSFLRKNLLPLVPGQLSILMKSVIQTYNHALITNSTTVVNHKGRYSASK